MLGGGEMLRSLESSGIHTSSRGEKDRHQKEHRKALTSGGCDTRSSSESTHRVRVQTLGRRREDMQRRGSSSLG